MKLSQVRSFIFYKALLLYGLTDNTGPKQEKSEKLRLGEKTSGYKTNEWVLGTGAEYQGNQKTPAGDKPISGKNYLDYRSGSSNKPWIVFEDTKKGYNNAFKCIFAFLLKIKAPYRIIEKKDGDRLLIKNLFEVE